MQNSYENDKIAGIYEKMMNGDNNAFNEIQRIQVKQYHSSNQNNSSHLNNNSPELKEEKSPDKNKVKKNENFRSYLREKVTELRNAKYDSKRQLSKNDKANQNKQFREPKPFPKAKKRNDAKSEKNTVTGETKNRIDQIFQQKGGSLNKIKTTSNNFQQKISKNIIRDKEESQKISTPPTSKHSIRIRQPGAVKKKMEELLKINQEQRRLQTEILTMHNETKDQVQQIKDKYSIESKYFEILSEDPPSYGSVLDEVSKKFEYIDKEEKNVFKINNEIDKLNAEITERKNKIKRAEAQIQSSPLLPFLKNEFEDIFQERQSEEDEDVFELPSKQHKQIDPSMTYQNMMGQKRKKIWGLKQRTGYEPRKTQNSMVIEKETHRNVQNAEKQKEQNDENKIVVNSRFKQFLLDQN